MWGGLIVLMACLAYTPALRAHWIWDDDAYVTENPTLRTAGGLYRIWFDVRALPQYYPLVHTTFWIEYRIWGANPFGYHLVNILLHAASAVLLWRLLRRLSVPGAWVAGAVFALHPVSVESVAWVTERKNVLSVLLYLASLHCFVGYYGLDRDGDPTRRRAAGEIRSYASGVVFFVAAMLSKTVSASLPVIVALLIWWKRGRLTRGELIPLAPVAVFGATLGLLTAWLEKHHVGAEGAEWTMTFLERCLVAGRALWFYAWKLIWPVELTFVYPRWRIDSGMPWLYLFPLAVFAVIVTLWSFRDRIGRGPLTAVLCFVTALGPALGFFDVYPMRYSYVADHFQYHASAALIALAVAVAASLLARSPTAARVAAAVLLIALSTLTWRQAGSYRDEETLWRKTLARNPGAWMAHNNLGEILVRQGKLDEGIEHYLETLRLKPDHANARSNLGAALASQGKLDEAVAPLREALSLTPDVAQIRLNLGIVLFQLGRLDEAVSELAEAIRLAPDYARAHEMLATVFAMQGRLGEAVDRYEDALRLAPALSSARYNLAQTLQSLGQLDRAAVHYREHLRRHPRDGQARVALAAMLIDQERLAEARSELDQALRIRPDDAGARELLSEVLRRQGLARP